MRERLNREIKRRSRVVRGFPSEASPVRLAGAVRCEAREEWSSRRHMEPSGIEALFFWGGGAPRRRSPTQRRGRSAAPDRGSSRSRGLTGWKRRRKFDLSLVLGRGAYTTFRDVTLASSLYFLVFQFVKLSS